MKGIFVFIVGFWLSATALVAQDNAAITGVISDAREVFPLKASKAA